MGKREIHARFERWVISVGSQSKAGELLGVHQTQVGRWCRGDRDPDINGAVRIEAATADWPEGPIRVAEWSTVGSATGTDG